MPKGVEHYPPPESEGDEGTAAGIFDAERR